MIPKCFNLVVPNVDEELRLWVGVGWIGLKVEEIFPM